MQKCDETADKAVHSPCLQKQVSGYHCQQCTTLMCMTVLFLKGDMQLTSSLWEARCDELAVGTQLIRHCWQLFSAPHCHHGCMGEVC